MRLRSTVLLLLALPACAVPSRIVDPRDDQDLTVDLLADRLADADVVFLGETHGNSSVHETHLAIVQALHARRPQLAISMEMFERDVQKVLYEYLLGDIGEGEFMAQSRPWPGYATDYRPLIQWARANGVPVLAANAPRALAAKVAKEGLESVAGETHLAREVTAPEDDYFLAFQAEMKDHVGANGDEKLRRYYESQCLKDDTMAETIAEFLRAERMARRNTMVVHVCGKFHSDRRLGTVARVRSREPGWNLMVVSAQEVPDPEDRMYSPPQDLADFVVVAKEQERKPVAKKEGAAAAAAAAPAGEKAAAGEAKPVHPGAGASAAPESGARPGLGLMPDYEAGEAGMRVAMVVEGGAAAAAGIEEGDVIVKLAGLPVEDVQGYTEALDAQKIGETVEVVVKRGDAEKVLKVKVATRNR